MSRKPKRTSKSSSHASEAIHAPKLPDITLEERFLLLLSLRLAGAFFILAAVLGIMHPEWRVWGVHHLAFLPDWLSLTILILGGLFLSPFGPSVIRKFSASLSFFTKRSAWLWALLAFGVFFGLRISVPLLGDSQLWIRELTWVGELDATGGKVKAGRIFMRKEPLSLALHEGVFEMMRVVKPYRASLASSEPQNKQKEERLNYFRDLARDTYSYLSMLAGALTALILVQFARRYIPAEGRAPFFLMLLSGGGILLFFGYVENYSWTSFWIIACLLSGISESLSDVKFPWKTVLIFLIAIGFHYAAVILLPGILLLLFNFVRHKKDIEQGLDQAPTKRAKVFAIVFVVLGLGGYVWVKGWEGWISVIPLLPQWSKDGYSFVSAAHWIDLLNLFALVSLSAIVIWFSLKPSDKSSYTENSLNGFLKLSAGAGVVFVLLFNPNLGMPRDWDMLALALWPLIIFSAWRIAHLKSVNNIALLSTLCGLVMLISLPSLLVNHTYAASIDRFKNLLALDRTRAAYGWENLALHYQRRGLIENRMDAWKHAIDLERNPRYLFNYADAMKLAGRLEEAVPYYIEAALMMRDSEIKIYREQLLYVTASLIAQEKFKKAHEVLDVAIEIMPDNEYAKRLLLMLDDAAHVDSLMDVGDYEGAKATVLAAREKDPQNSYWVKILNKIKQKEGMKE
jgi:hypothetical protein